MLPSSRSMPLELPTLSLLAPAPADSVMVHLQVLALLNLGREVLAWGGILGQEKL